MTDTSDEFDWDDAESFGSIVQRAVDEVAIYENPHGDIVIRKRADWDEEHDKFIVIAKGNVQAFIAKVKEVAEMVDIDQAPLTGAERQRRYRERHLRNGKGDGDGDAPLLVAAE